MKILLITQHFYPDLVSTGLHMTELTTKWKELYPDVNISVFTAENSRESESENYKSYECYQGISVFRVRNIGKHHGNLYRRFLFSIGFIFNAFFFLIKNKGKYNRLIITTNPPFLGLLVLLLNLVNRVPYVVIAYDLYPQILAKMGILSCDSYIYKFWKWLNIRVYNNSSKIISIGEDMTKIILEDMIIKDVSKIELIHNWSDKNKVFPVEESKNEFLIKNKFIGKKIFLYSGTMGSTHNIEDILGAAYELREETNILFLFIGSGAKEALVKNYIDTHGLQNVVLMPFQPISIISQTLSSATMSFVCLDSEFTGLSVPSKSYGILAAKVPIVGLMDFDSEISKTIFKFKCGVVWNKDCGISLSSLIKQLLSDPKKIQEMRENAYDAFLNNFDIEKSVHKYNRILKSI